MWVKGVVKNGTVILDEGSDFPEGARVEVALTEAFEYPHPLAPYDRDKEVALLRERLAEMDAGVPGYTVEEVFAKLRSETLERKNRKGS